MNRSDFSSYAALTTRFLELNLVKSHKFLRRVIMMETVAPTLPFLIRAMVSSSFYKVRLVPSDHNSSDKMEMYHLPGLIHSKLLLTNEAGKA